MPSTSPWSSHVDFLWYAPPRPPTHTLKLLKPELLAPGREVRKQPGQVWVATYLSFWEVTLPLHLHRFHVNLTLALAPCWQGGQELSWPIANEESILNRPLNCQHISSFKDQIRGKLTLKNGSRNWA